MKQLNSYLFDIINILCSLNIHVSINIEMINVKYTELDVNMIILL